MITDTCKSSATKSRGPTSYTKRPKKDGTLTGRWSKEEHYRFLEALKRYGKEWKLVQQHVATRSST